MRRAPSQGLFRWLAVAAIVVGISATAPRAHAQAEPPEAGFGDKGHFAIAAERMFGYVHVSQDQTNVGTTTTRTSNSISLLGSPISNAASVYTYPRVGFDAFIAPSISLGGSLTYFHLSQSGNGNSNTASGFLVAPRLGFAARLGQSAWLWPRAGITYVSLSVDVGAGTSETVSLFAATVEAPVVVMLAPQAILLIGPTVDLGLSGSTKLNGGTLGTGTNSDQKETDIGVQAGFALSF
jgi:hypothetical protein